MNIKNFLLAAVALAVIGAGGSISIHYQMLRMEHTKKRELADQYFPKELRSWHYIDYTTHSPSLNKKAESSIEKLKEEMHADGYSYAEIAAIDNRAYQEAHDQCNSRQQQSTGKYEVTDPE